MSPMQGVLIFYMSKWENTTSFVTSFLKRLVCINEALQYSIRHSKLHTVLLFTLHRVSYNLQ